MIITINLPLDTKTPFMSENDVLVFFTTVSPIKQKFSKLFTQSRNKIFETITVSKLIYNCKVKVMNL